MKSRGLKSIVARRNAVGQGCKMFLPTLCDTFAAELLQAMEEGKRIEVAEGFSTFLKCVARCYGLGIGDEEVQQYLQAYHSGPYRRVCDGREQIVWPQYKAQPGKTIV